MELLIQLALLWLLWLVSPRRWQKRLTVFMVGVAFVLTAISPFGVQVGIWSLTVGVPSDTGETVDAIVVLGRGTALRDLRTALVQELWQAKRAPQIFASGMMDARPIVQNLAELGVPPRSLSGEECSQSTWENGLFTAALLHQTKPKILLVTDSVHMLRSLLTFRSFGFRVVPHSSALPTQLSHQNKLTFLLREYTGLVQYALTKRLIQPDPQTLKPPSVEVMQKIQAWGCYVQGTL